MGTNRETDIELIELVKTGHTAAYRELITRYKDYAYTIAFRVLANREDAEEVTQDAFVKVYKGVANFQANSKFSTWLYRIVLNTAISYKRKKKIPVETLEDYKVIGSGEISNMQEYQQLEQKKFIQLALNTMLPDDVSVITLFYFKELSLEEMSEITGIAVNTLKVKLFRARKRLFETLGRILKKEVTSLI